MSPRAAAELTLYRAAGALVPRLPPSWTHALARAAARAAFRLGGRRARWTLTNLRFAYPDASEGSLRAIAAASYQHFACNLIDFLRCARWDDAELERHVTLHGLENLRAARALGRGVLVLTGHLGNFELGGRACVLGGFPVAAVARPMRNAALYASIRNQRKAHGVRVIDKRNAAPRVLRALRRGEVVVILNDQYARRARAVFAPLFGLRCSTSAGLALLALRSGAPVVPAYMCREGGDRHVGFFQPALDFSPSGDRERDVLELTALCNAALEAMIRKHPEQWMWGTRRFRHSPDLPGNPYTRAPGAGAARPQAGRVV